MTTTGQRLKMLRELRGQSQADIAKLIGVGRTTYLKYESDENKPTRKLKELSNLFNVSGDYIMGLTDNPDKLNNFLEQKGSALDEASKKIAMLSQPSKLQQAYDNAPPEIQAAVDAVLAPYQVKKEKRA